MAVIVDDPFNVTEGLEKFPKILDYDRRYGGLQCVVFEKHDGTNLAWRWSNGDFEWPTFRSGRSITREVELFSDLLPVFGDVILAAKTWLIQNNVSDAVFFTEFRGNQSFSGKHVPGDPKTLHPIDLWIKDKGFMPPLDFANAFGVVPIYRGKLTSKFVDDVRKGRLIVNEGVICKGGSDYGEVWVCKIKTDAWLERGGDA